MIDIERAFHRLAASTFRSRFTLKGRELAYLQTWGIDRVMEQAGRFIDERLAPASPRNNGRQTPWGNHPVFVAQHATATCCRGCLERVHKIAKGQALTDQEKGYVLSAIERWLRQFLS